MTVSIPILNGAHNLFNQYAFGHLCGDTTDFTSQRFHNPASVLSSPADIQPPKATQVSRTFRGPVGKHRSITSTPLGLPRSCSGKLVINPDGIVSTEYNKFSDPSSFWRAAPLYRPSSPSVEVDLTSDNINFSAASVPHFPDLPRPELPILANPFHRGLELRSHQLGATLLLGPIRSGQLYNLPKHRHDKPRRLLALPDGDDIVNVSMHGFIDKIYIKPVK